MMDIEQNGWIGGTTQIERDDSKKSHPALSFDLSMISGQTLRVSPEGKPVPTFPDHALVSKKSGEFQGDAAC
jgi:hypothetical protein